MLELECPRSSPTSDGPTVPFGTSFVENSLRTAIVIVDGNQGPAIPDTRVVVLRLVLFETKVRESADESATDRPDASPDPGSGDCGPTTQAEGRCKRTTCDDWSDARK